MKFLLAGCADELSKARVATSPELSQARVAALPGPQNVDMLAYMIICLVVPPF
jgi:hypothetical protein